MKFLMKLVAFISIWCCGNKIITVSKSKAKEIKKRYGKTCAIIPCGIPVNNNYTESDIIDRFNISKGEYYLTIGRIDPIKNLDTLIKAFIMHDNQSKQLVIAGNYENKYGKSLKELAKNNLMGAQNLAVQCGGIIGEVTEEAVRIFSEQKKRQTSKEKRF